MNTDLLGIRQDTVDAFFQENPYYITKHHLDSFDAFLEHEIPRSIKSMNPINISKFDPQNKPRHRIEVYVGGVNCDRLFFERPSIMRGDGSFARPMYPNDARLNDLTYAITLKADVDVVHYYYGKQEGPPTRLQDVKVGRIPLMLHSRMCPLRDKPPALLREMGECIYEQGGYFIVDGKEKVIVAQERNITNKLFATESHDPTLSHEAFIRCTEPDSVFAKKTVFYVAAGTGIITVNFPHLNFKVPLFVLFRALGVESDRDILEYIIQSADLDSFENQRIVHFLFPSLTHGNFLYTKIDALEFLKEYTPYRTTSNVEYLIWKNLFPNVPGEDEYGNITHNAKALFLGHVTKKLIRVVLGIDPPTDRDSYMYKRLAISGVLMAYVFKDFYNIYRRALLNKLHSVYDYGNWKQRGPLGQTITDANRHEFFAYQIIDEGLVTSLKGLWGLERRPLGIVQDLNRFSFASYVSHMRMARSPMDPSIKIRNPHQLHSSQYGVMCPVQSPDGENIGLVKNMSMSCFVSPESDSTFLVDQIMRRFFGPSLLFLTDILHGNHIGYTWIKILLNNTWIACLTDQDKAIDLVDLVRLLRRNNLISIFTSVSWNIATREINVLTEGGRVTRPLLVVPLAEQKGWDIYGRNSLTFDQLLARFGNGPEAIPGLKTYLTQTASAIEFIDVEEANHTLIAMYPADLARARQQYSHCEIHPSFMFSMYPATIPFANHNAAPRNIFSSMQGKWAIGVYATNFPLRIDTVSYVLHYPQKRLVQTRFNKYALNNELPNGENLIVAIASYTGYNQDDAVILNKGSVERGCFNITAFKAYKAEEQQDQNVRILFGNPFTYQESNNDIKIKQYADYSKIDSDGFPKLGEYFEEGDALLGRVKITNQEHEDRLNAMGQKEVTTTYESKTEVLDKTLSGYADQVYVRQSYSTGLRNIKIRLRKTRVPEMGDKVASTHSQKGVCGMILDQADMPYTRNGVVPDIIINPHAFPTRATVGHILEALLAKSAVSEGAFADATPFQAISTEGFSEILARNGYQRYGNEVMYDGESGRQIDSDIFLAPTYYYRLKHMVADKINYRETGKVNQLTHQPTQGRANEGGLRIGEMEVNAINAHGMIQFGRESLMQRSDGDVFFLDREAGRLGMAPYKVREGTRVHVPRAFKVLTQELQGMSIGTHLVTTESEGCQF